MACEAACEAGARHVAHCPPPERAAAASAPALRAAAHAGGAAAEHAPQETCGAAVTELRGYCGRC